MNEQGTKIDDFLSFIEKRIIKPINEKSINESCTATLLLIFAAIDSLSKITCNDDEFKQGVGVRFKSFLEKVMDKEYTDFREDIYDLRNDIVHTGINVKVTLSKGPDNRNHLQKVNGLLWINTKQLFDDFNESFKQIKNDISNKGEYYYNAEKRLKSFNIVNICENEYDGPTPSPGPDDSIF